jgi:hypothetical protein
MLAPTRHAAEYQLAIAGQADFRSEAEPLHDPGTKALEQNVSAVDQLQHCFGGVGILQVDGQ